MPEQTPRQDLVVSEILNRSLQLYVDNPKLLLTLSFLSIAGTLLTRLLDLFGALWADMLSLIMIPCSLVAGLIFLQALNVAVARRYLGEAVSAGEALHFVLKRFWVLAGGSLVFLLMILVGTILLIVPGMYWMTVFFFFPFAILFEDRSLWQSFQVSDDLMKGHFWKVTGGHTAIGLIALALLLPLWLGLFLLGAPMVVIELLTQVVIAFLLPLMAAFYYQVYLWLKNERSQTGRISLQEVA